MYIVTDLTRFGPGNPNVCTALIEMDSGQCIRPMPYYSFEVMKKHSVIPGAIFTGRFTPRAQVCAPHMEDCDCSNVTLAGSATRAQFEGVLMRSARPSISEGFEIALDPGQKVLPDTYRGPRSIITLEIDPQDIEILSDQYDPSKIKTTFRDRTGTQHRYLPITDLGFYDYARSKRTGPELAQLNERIQVARKVFLRIGLSRTYRSPDGRSGYWLQVNGIYTFPSRIEIVRGYTA